MERKLLIVLAMSTFTASLDALSKPMIRKGESTTKASSSRDSKKNMIELQNKLAKFEGNPHYESLLGSIYDLRNDASSKSPFKAGSQSDDFYNAVKKGYNDSKKKNDYLEQVTEMVIKHKESKSQPNKGTMSSIPAKKPKTAGSTIKARKPVPTPLSSTSRNKSHSPR